MKKQKKSFYSRNEEILNTLSHGLGTGLAIIFLGILLYKGIKDENIKKVVGFSIYGFGLIAMFLSSTLYHGVTNIKAKRVLRVFDHCSIFLCIAGTYTPIALLVFNNKLSIIILSLIWSIAIFGIILKIVSFIKGKVKKTEIISLVLYLGMGWLSLFLIRGIVKNIGWNFFIYILIGGLWYSVGVYFYRNKNIKFNHAIWHLFILGGSVSMFLGIFKYLA